jgi:hypothetical protein
VNGKRPDRAVEQKNNTPPQPQVAPAKQAGGPSGTDPARILPYVNFKERDANRALPTDRMLELLRRWMPRQCELAEVVGKWVWITFPEQPADQAAA